MLLLQCCMRKCLYEWENDQIELSCMHSCPTGAACIISLNGNVYQITVHKSLHGNIRITSPKWKNAYVCACGIGGVFLRCMWMCVSKCECVCLLPSNKWCMGKLGKVLALFGRAKSLRSICYGATVLRIPQWNEIKTWWKTARLMCSILECWCQHYTVTLVLFWGKKNWDFGSLLLN